MSLHTLPVPEPGVPVHLGVVSLYAWWAGLAEGCFSRCLQAALLSCPSVRVKPQLSFFQHYFFTAPDLQELPSIPENVSIWLFSSMKVQAQGCSSSAG